MHEQQRPLCVAASGRVRASQVVSPNTNFDGNDTRKSISMKRGVRIDKNINIEEEEENNAIASNMKNTLNQILFKKIGVAVSWLLQPNTVKAIAKTTVIINVAMITQ